jgi:hypothetical protein
MLTLLAVVIIYQVGVYTPQSNPLFPLLLLPRLRVFPAQGWSKMKK